jgi:thiol-disulfide isomerase/thioredoxin
MAARTRPRPTARPARGRPAPAPPPRAWIWFALAGVIALAAVLAIVLSGGSDDPPSAEGVEETRPVAVSGAALPAVSGDTDPAIGLTIPTVEGAAFDGTPVTISPDDGPMVLLVAAHWCPHCQAEIPALTDHLAANPLPAGVSLVTISTSTSADRPNYPPSAWLQDEGWDQTVLADNEESAAAAAFGVDAFPYFVAVDAEGTVVARTSGEISTDQFDQLVQLALGADG